VVAEVVGHDHQVPGGPKMMSGNRVNRRSVWFHHVQTRCPE
jgi:hypothetical protein